jgi:hypothetical protein
MSLTASINPIVFDTSTGINTGPSSVSYRKDEFDEIWTRAPGSVWMRANPHILTGRGDEADREGSFPVDLKPGETFDIGIFQEDHGPLATDPLPRETLTVFCLLKNGQLRLITDENTATGGTWHSHQLATNVPTTIIAIGLSRTPPTFDGVGIPHLDNTEGGPTASLSPASANHLVQVKPLLPGNHYFFVALVTDSLGNWDFKVAEVDTLRRKITVQFSTLHIHNDGDGGGYGEGEFWFRVGQSSPSGYSILDDFHRDTQDIDDWSETDRPYSLGYAHLGQLKAVAPGEEGVFVTSWAIEHDGIFDSDEGAGFNDTWLPLPNGQGMETSVNNFLHVDCPTATVDDDFHYSMDVLWSVEYMP